MAPIWKVKCAITHAIFFKINSKEFLMENNEFSSEKYILSYEGIDREVPADKVQELDDLLHNITEDFWDKYFNER